MNVNSEPNELDAYKKAITEMYESQSDVPVSNSKADHAAALYELFFNKAKNRIVIFCNNGAKDIFEMPTVITAFKGAIEKGISVMLVAQTALECQSIKDMARNSVNFIIKMASKSDADRLENFCVVDEHAFRYEPNKTKFEGFARMNYPEDAKKLIARFDQIWERAQECSPA